MRTVALALALMGCDSIFGLHHTEVLDSRPFDVQFPTDAVPLTISLQWQVSETTATGIPTTPVVAPIVPAPAVSIGPMGVQATLLTYDASGGVEVPYQLAEQLAGTTYRFTYTIGTDTVEVQTDRMNLNLFVPSLSRVTAPKVPTSSGYDFAPGGMAPYQLQNPQFATSGVYTLTQLPVPPPLPYEVRFPFLGATRMLGGSGAPQSSHGDWELLLDWPATMTDPYTITGYAITEVDLVAGGLSTPAAEPTWETAQVSHGYNADTLTCGGRLQTAVSALGELPSPTQPTFPVKYGIVPSTQTVPLILGPGGIDQPLMIPLYTGSTATSNLTVIDIAQVAQQPAAILTGCQWARSSDGLTLTSSLQSVTTYLGNSAQSAPYAAPLATQVMFYEESLNSGADVPVPSPTTPTATLMWSPENIATTADDYIVRLYKVLGGGVVLLQTYQVTKPQVAVDTSLLHSGDVYAFGITARVGIANAQTGDYSMVALPFSEATVFPATFKMN